MSFDPAKLSDFPETPGVYLMKGRRGEVLYVGKAKNLKNRLRSYFAAGGDTRIQVPYLLAQVVTIETIVVLSEKEALLLENTLIKKHQPKYNVLLKDDKGYISLKVTSKHPWPQIFLVRYKGAPPKDGTYYGPFTNATAARQMFDLAGKLFPLRQCSDDEFARRTRPCILYQIKRCSAPCVGLVTKEQYDEYLRGAVSLFKGQNEQVINMLESEMNKAIDALEFERAKSLYEKKLLLEQTMQTQRVDSLTSEDADAWGIFREGADVVVTMLFWREGKLAGSHHFDFENAFQQTHEILESCLMQHYLEEKSRVGLVLLAEPLSDFAALSEVISECAGKKVEVRVPERGEKRTFVAMATANAYAAFKQKKDANAMREKALLELQEKLSLSRYPEKIECFDNSHFSQSELVSSCVSFVDGAKCKAGFRKYRIRTVSTGDDYAMMKEALTRHYNKAKIEGNLPDLIVIDGGKGHLSAAEKILRELEIVTCELISVAKEEGRHDKGVSREKIYKAGSKEPIILAEHSPALFLLQQIRDEAHRFVLAFQTSRRSKASIKSELDYVPGIGPAKKKRLIATFGSVKSIRQKSIEELQEVKGITKKDAQSIFEYFQKA